MIKNLSTQNHLTHPEIASNLTYLYQHSNNNECRVSMALFKSALQSDNKPYNLTLAEIQK